jgi:uncharacterized BrkB/YihY/UPF0761 family membrane protein
MGSSAPMSADAAARVAAETAMGRLPPRLRAWLAWLLSRWPGRILLRSAATCIRIEVFDRSVTIAAQFFTSVFPILILFATWVGADDADRFADAVNMPAESRAVLEDAVQGSTGAAFGVVGVLMVLGSATSLSRALTRAFAAIWDLPRPRTRLVLAWRWLAAVLALALSLLVVSALGGYAADLAPRNVWQLALALGWDLALAVFVPWVLLAGAVQPRQLVPGALLFALGMLAVRPVSRVYLPHALEVSADRYGSIGVAFTYLAWLYVVSFLLLLTAVVGQVVATDGGRFGSWIHEPPAAKPRGDGERPDPTVTAA